MRDKKRFISVILITSVMLFAGGCSKQDGSVGAEPTETVKEVDTEESVESSEIQDNSEDEAIVEDEIIIIDETVPEETEVDDEDEETTKTETSKTGGSNNGSTNSGSSDSTNNPQSAHTHNWIAHTATRQVWVPHIVVVDDYEYQVVGRVDDVFICDCGYSTTSRDDIANHIHSNIGNEGHGGFTMQPGHDIIEGVKVGSHEEDHGYYEPQTYVDYYYCDCGATKN